MNINRISNTNFNTPFKGAYFIAGDGGKVKEAEEAIKQHAKDLDMDIYVDKRIGHGYTTVNLPTVIFVATGDDIEEYDKFLLNKDEYCRKSEKIHPDPLENKNFKTNEERNIHKILRKAFINMKAIKENCKFKNGTKNLKADNVLKAINEKKFNYEDGSIKG